MPIPSESSATTTDSTTHADTPPGDCRRGQRCSANGYPDVRLDDVGEAVGIAGPSVLAHFATKKQILVAAFDRGITQRMISASVAIDDADRADQALHRLVTGLAETAARNRDLFTMLLR